MKIQIALVLMAALLPACGSSEGFKEAVKSKVSSADAAANELYLEDVVDSAAGTTGGETVDSGTDSPSDQVDDSVKDDMRSERLQQMVEKMFKELDADSSGSLTIDEFLVSAEKRAEEKGLSAEKTAKIIERLTADFNKAAGEDKALTLEEAKSLLKGCGSRVGRHRDANFPGGQQERVQQTAESVLAEFDTNKDGSLSQEEIQAMIDARRAENQKWCDDRDSEDGDDGHRRGGRNRGPGSDSSGSGSGRDHPEDDSTPSDSSNSEPTIRTARG